MQHDRRHDLNTGEAGDATQHDRKHNLNAGDGGAAPADHTGERHAGLSARSLAARGDAPDGSDDGPSDARDQADGSAGE